MNRIQQLLMGVLLVQLIVAAAVFWPQGSVHAADAPLLSEFNKDKVTAVLVEDGDSQVKLTRADDGWVLANSDDFPAESEQVETLLENLAAVKTNRLVTQTAASHGRLKIGNDDFVRRITLEGEDGNRYTLLLGTAANARSAHLRLADDDTVYLANDLRASDVGALAQDWIDTTYVDLERDEITEIIVENEHGTFVMSRTADGSWTYAGLGADESLVESRIGGLRTRISNVRMLEPLGRQESAAYALDDPLARVTVALENEEGEHTYTLLVGAADEANDSYVVKWSESDYFVRVSGFHVNEFVNLSHSDLAELPEAKEEDPIEEE